MEITRTVKTAIICGAGIVSGKEIMALELGDGLRDNGCSVFYVTSLWGNGDFTRRLQSREFRFARMRIGFISATLTVDNLRMTADQVVRWPKLLYDYNRFLLRERPDYIIHTNWHHLLLLLPLLRSHRDIFWLHDVVPPKPRYAQVFTTFSHRIRGFVAVSNPVARSLSRIGVPDAKIRVVNNGIKDPAQSPFKAQCQSGLRLGIVGQVGAWKGHEDLLEAFSAISPLQRGVSLHIFGEDTGEFGSRLKMRTRELGLGGNVIWHGFTGDRSCMYRSIDICVVPSRFEDPFPLVALEAAFFGLPVIASRKGGLAEIVVDGSTGYLVDGENLSQLAARMDELLQNHRLRTAMGAAARRHALENFSGRRFVDNFLELLNPTNDFDIVEPV